MEKKEEKRKGEKVGINKPQKAKKKKKENIQNNRNSGTALGNLRSKEPVDDTAQLIVRVE